MYKQIDANKRKTFLFISIFLIFIIGLGWILSYAFNAYWILILAVIIAIIQALSSYYWSDKIALSISGAHPASRKKYLELHRIVENLSIAAGLLQPDIYIIDDPSPNAFATGRDPKHSSIAVTSGLLEKLDKTELEGVISHEMSHIGNYDIRLMTIVVVLVGIAALVSDFFLRWSWFGGGFRRRDGDGNGQIGVILMLVGIILAILSPIVAILIQLAISRRREYLADASGALLTRYPEGLADALEKISDDQNQLRRATNATAHLYIANPFKGKNITTLFATHPLIEDRIKKLRKMINK
jgi:heat shock protein HtpX